MWIDFMIAVMASQSAIHQLAGQVMAKYSHLEVLVNNVGVSTPHRQITPDEIELIFAVNHLATFLLTHHLLPLLKRDGSQL